MADFNTGLNAEQLMKALNAIQTINNEEPDENHNIDINAIATDVNYDNTDSNLEAENVQDAIDEVVGKIEQTNTVVATKADTSDITDLQTQLDIESARIDELTTPPDGQKDMKTVIEKKLTDNGVCMLQDGDYYVSGISMPTKSAIIGIGKKSRIILMDSVTDGAAIKMNSECTVQNITIYGGENTVSSTIGTRHGILWQGTGSSATSPFNGVITGCMIKGFSGGGITCSNTSTGTVNHITANNCFIQNCNVGINIQASAEYNKFTNIRTYACYYSCYNLGGNNIFVGCDFSKSTIGFKILASANNGHGGAIGCTFNHIGDNTGIAIDINGTNNGFSFVGCQLFFGMISIQNASGILFDSCVFGNSASISVVQDSSHTDGTVQFSNCNFASIPTITSSKNTKFSECYTRNGQHVGSRNLFPYFSGTSDNAAKTFKGNGLNIPAGNYELFFQSITSTDTDDETCRIRFFDSDLNGVSSYYQIPRGNNVHLPITLTGTASIVWIIPSSQTSTIGDEDVMTFSGAMLCTEDEWERSQDFAFYNPSTQELYQMIATQS